MKHLIKIATKSIWSRKWVTALLILSLSLSTLLLLGVEKLQVSAKESFQNSISGVDLIVGPRGGASDLLLYSVFRLGQPSGLISWQSVQTLKKEKTVKFAIPFSLGDSHRGYPVMGTESSYFEHYKYGRRQPLTFQKGRAFNSVFELVLGAEVAKKYAYNLNDFLFLSHGMHGHRHDQVSFKVVGILSPTQTPVDRTVYIPIEGITAMHSDLGMKAYTPKAVSGVLLGAQSKAMILYLKQRLSTGFNEPLMGIIPGVELAYFWRNLKTINQGFKLISYFVMTLSFLSLVLVMLISLNYRKKELKLLRIIGAKTQDILLILMLESLLVTVIAMALGLVLLMGVGALVAPFMEAKFGLLLNLSQLSQREFTLLGLLFGLGVLISLIPPLFSRSSKKDLYTD